MESRKYYYQAKPTEIYLNETYAIQEIEMARVIEKRYGFGSGLEFLALSIMFAISFYILAKLLNQGKNLN